MTPKQYETALHKLGMSQRGSAGVIGIDERTSRRYISGESPVPNTVAKLLRLMIEHGIDPEEVAKL